MSNHIDRDKRDAKRYRFIKKRVVAWTGEKNSYFSIMIEKEVRSFGPGKPTKVVNYRTLNGAVDHLMRKVKGRTR